MNHSYLSQSSPSQSWRRATAAAVQQVRREPRLQHWAQEGTLTLPRNKECIMSPQVRIALKLSGHFLVGLVRIYSWKVNYLFQDCNPPKNPFCLPVFVCVCRSVKIG
uniref:Rad21/Rec8-like protein N-terminal domain-containing protein n=3 Tax=Aegilops tauschii subsp. strangulata TaxID=200361 RepID=A0A453DEE5_AEGTS